MLVLISRENFHGSDWQAQQRLSEETLYSSIRNQLKFASLEEKERDREKEKRGKERRVIKGKERKIEEKKEKKTEQRKKEDNNEESNGRNDIKQTKE